jgi:cell division protein FtsW (lipid II flippase)
MRPITVLTLIILGSCLAITICLIAVWGLLFLTSLDPALAARIEPELKALPKHIAIFIPLTVISCLSFLSSQKQTTYRFIWQIVMWSSIAAVGVYYYQGM